tara:strand:- start:277 stop:417 length:141 start_codon:yes stop_codon:yes gene_type:complete
MKKNKPNLLFPRLPENLDRLKMPLVKANSESLEGYGFFLIAHKILK